MRSRFRRVRERALLPLVLAQEEIRDGVGAIRSDLAAQRNIGSIQDAEFRVYSQFGEDGILQYLLRSVPIERRYFIEFGVEDYSESNTRFLVVNDGWTGLILDGGSAHIDFVQSREWGWKSGIEARQAFITRKNVNEVIGQSVTGDVGVLSVDIDGMDYWVLEALDVISPRVLVAEYNSVFGPHSRVSVPYAPDFSRKAAHPSGLYFGASIGALADLAREKGYLLVGSNSAGCNAFFVRRDVAGGLEEVLPEDAWAKSRFRGVLDGRRGRLGDDAHEVAPKSIGHLPLEDVSTGRIDRAASLLGWVDHQS